MKNGYFIGNIPYFQTNPYQRLADLCWVNLRTLRCSCAGVLRQVDANCTLVERWVFGKPASFTLSLQKWHNAFVLWQFVLGRPLCVFWDRNTGHHVSDMIFVWCSRLVCIGNVLERIDALDQQSRTARNEGFQLMTFEARIYSNHTIF